MPRTHQSMLPQEGGSESGWSACLLDWDGGGSLEEEHLAHAGRRPTLQPGEVHPAGQRLAPLAAAVPAGGALVRTVPPRGPVAQIDLPHQGPPDIVDRQAHPRPRVELEGDPGLQVEGIGIVRQQGGPVRQRRRKPDRRRFWRGAATCPTAGWCRRSRLPTARRRERRPPTGPDFLLVLQGWTGAPRYPCPTAGPGCRHCRRGSVRRERRPEKATGVLPRHYERDEPPSRLARKSPVSASHSRTTRRPPLARVRPSGEKATLVALAGSTSRIFFNRASATDHRKI